MHAFIRTRHAVQRGFTMVELMIVIVIIAILAAVGYPSYTDYVMRSQRQAAKNFMYTVADRQEQFYQDNKQYAPDLSTLGFADDIVALGRDGQLTAVDGATRTYRVGLIDATPTTYTVQAVPQLVQAERDDECATLTLTHLNVRDQTGAGERCW